MAIYTVQLQRIWKEYERAGNPTPATAREVAAWALNNHLWEPKPEHDLVAQLAEDLARAWREDYRTDESGRRYRAMHAVRVTKSGVQYAFWADIDNAPRKHVEQALAQRRHQIVGDCYQLKTDADHYNDSHREEPKIQMVLDFTRDVEELQHVKNAA